MRFSLYWRSAEAQLMTSAGELCSNLHSTGSFLHYCSVLLISSTRAGFFSALPNCSWEIFRTDLSTSPSPHVLQSPSCNSSRDFSASNNKVNGSLLWTKPSTFLGPDIIPTTLPVLRDQHYGAGEPQYPSLTLALTWSWLRCLSPAPLQLMSIPALCVKFVFFEAGSALKSD